MGIKENETPFTFGAATSGLQFHWSVSSEKVASLQPLFYKVRDLCFVLSIKY